MANPSIIRQAKSVTVCLNKRIMTRREERLMNVPDRKPEDYRFFTQTHRKQHCVDFKAIFYFWHLCPMWIFAAGGVTLLLVRPVFGLFLISKRECTLHCNAMRLLTIAMTIWSWQ